MYYDSLIRNMSTIIFLIFSFLTKKEGKVSIWQHHFSLLLLCNFMVGVALCTAYFI